MARQIRGAASDVGGTDGGQTARIGQLPENHRPKRGLLAFEATSKTYTDTGLWLLVRVQGARLCDSWHADER